MVALILGVAAALSTSLGGVFALRKRDQLHLILGFSAGAVLGVAFFDLMPEALELGTKHYSSTSITSTIAIGFLIFMLLNRFMSRKSQTSKRSPQQIGAISLCIHSLFDGIGIGLAFQVSSSVGAIVAGAVLAHDFADGINTVSLVLKNSGERTGALRWLIADAIAPIIGVVIGQTVTLPQAQLSLVLALFCGFFLYIGASELLPESQHRHPQLITSLMTIGGACVIFMAIHFASF